jgi:2-aminoethylphosphonate dioxygenase
MIDNTFRESINKISDELLKNGVVCIKNFFSESEQIMIQEWAKRLENLPEVTGKYMKYYETSNNNNILSRIEYFVNYNSDIEHFLKYKINPILNDLCRKNMTLFKDKLNWKMGGGNGFKPHQDHPAWDDLEPPIFYSVAISADISNIDKGCLQFSKKENSILPYNTDGILPNISNNLDFKYVETTPRDLVIFDSFTPHKSDKNITNDSRRIFYFTYNSTSEGDFYEEYNKNKRSQFPPNIERDGNKVYDNKYNLANPIRKN